MAEESRKEIERLLYVPTYNIKLGTVKDEIFDLKRRIRAYAAEHGLHCGIVMDCIPAGRDGFSYLNHFYLLFEHADVGLAYLLTGRNYDGSPHKIQSGVEIDEMTGVETPTMIGAIAIPVSVNPDLAIRNEMGTPRPCELKSDKSYLVLKTRAKGPNVSKLAIKLDQICNNIGVRGHNLDTPRRGGYYLDFEYVDDATIFHIMSKFFKSGFESWCAEHPKSD